MSERKTIDTKAFTDLQDAVNEALKNAINNGYHQDMTSSAEEVAVDMMTYDATIEKMVGKHEFSVEEVARAVDHARYIHPVPFG